MEDNIGQLFRQNVVGSFLDKEHAKLKVLEEHKARILVHEESLWRFKSKVIWIVEGDNNTIFFHKYVAHLDTMKTIWDLDSTTRCKIHTFNDLSKAGRIFFESLLCKPLGSHIMEELKVTHFYPRIFYQDYNRRIKALVTKEEISKVLLNLKWSKSSRLDRWTVEFF